MRRICKSHPQTRSVSSRHLRSGRCRLVATGMAVVAALTVGTGFAEAQTSGALPPDYGCPDGWSELPSPPFDAELGCAPDFVENAVDPARGPSGGCPAMWKSARLPLNPKLGCVPGFVSAAAGFQRGSAGTCPPTWKQAFPPLNPLIKCVPGFLSSAVRGG